MQQSLLGKAGLGRPPNLGQQWFDDGSNLGHHRRGNGVVGLDDECAGRASTQLNQGLVGIAATHRVGEQRDGGPTTEAMAA